MSETYEDVAAANAIRTKQIREWAAKQVDPTLVLTEIPDEPVLTAPQEEPTPAPEADVEPAEAVPPADRSEIEVPETYEEEVARLTVADEDGTVDGDDEEEKDESEQSVSDESSDEEIDEQPEERDPTDAEEGAADQDGPEAPAHNANKGEWVAYRIETHGFTEDEANEYTKQQLIDLG